MSSYKVSGELNFGVPYVINMKIDAVSLKQAYFKTYLAARKDKNLARVDKARLYNAIKRLHYFKLND